MKNIFKTQRGSTVELVTEHITSEIINADGHEVSVKCDKIEITELKINGKKEIATLTEYQGHKVLNYGCQTIKGKKHQMLVLIPTDVYDKVWGEYDKRISDRIKTEIEAENKYQAHHNAVKKMMQE